MESTCHTTFFCCRRQNCKALMYWWHVNDHTHLIQKNLTRLDLHSLPVQGKGGPPRITHQSHLLHSSMWKRRRTTLVCHSKFWWVSNIHNRTTSVLMFWFFHITRFSIDFHSHKVLQLFLKYALPYKYWTQSSLNYCIQFLKSCWVISN